MNKLFYGSSYDRGLDVLLAMWPRIRKEFPEATLSIAYGWDLFDMAYRDNKERQQWKSRVQAMMNQPGVEHYGRLGKDDLEMVRKGCDIWAYPTYFPEINCITALDAQNDGLVPVTMNYAALKETAKHGILIEGSIEDKEVREKYLQELLKLMGDKKEWKRRSNKCKKFARKYQWGQIADKWIEEFERPEQYDTKVTVYTPTVREGWWNIMANNLANQEYTNFEWIIVDDHEDDRSDIAKKYAKVYNLDIKYMRGKKRKIKRTYGLINANNTAIEAASGDLFVFLQDFILLHPTALKELVRESARHPNAFIAPVDAYFEPKVNPDTSDKEDWFGGNIDVIGDHIRTNIRKGNWGMRKTETVTDFEQNFGAVPTRILRDLGGYYEFFDEALGWDDTEIIYRAFKKGYELWIDENIVAVCIDHMGTLGKDEGGKSVNRMRRLNNPRYAWMVDQIEKGELPLVRTQKVDDKIDLQYEIPDWVEDKDCDTWVKKNIMKIKDSWL